VLNGEVLIPYRWAASGGLAAHFFNVRITGDVLLARFAWFEVATSGYALMRVENESRLSGGWWYDYRILEKLGHRDKRSASALPDMNAIVLVKKRGLSRIPEWAENYFQDPKLMSHRPDPEARNP
jgi:hypothetical protein